MPRSKRAQLVALTQTSKKNRDHKTLVVRRIRDAVDGSRYVYLLRLDNVRSAGFKRVRKHFRDVDPNSRILLGKNRLLRVALGRAPEDEHADNLRRVSALVTGSVGLLCTDAPRDEVLAYLASPECRRRDFARSGDPASATVTVTSDDLVAHPVSMCEHFRKLGLAVDVDHGRLVFPGGRTEHTICKEGATLSVEACRLLTHFGRRLSEFRVETVCVWERESSMFEELS